MLTREFEARKSALGLQRFPETLHVNAVIKHVYTHRCESGFFTSVESVEERPGARQKSLMIKQKLSIYFGIIFSFLCSGPGAVSRDMRKKIL